MNFLRGLFALIFTLFIHTTLQAEYLYRDELIFNPDFNASIEKIGSELHQKTGISLKLVMLKELPKDVNIVDYEKESIKSFNEPTILLVFSELDSKVDILASSDSLYQYFDKKQVLSPVASPLQAFIVALFYSSGLSSFKEIVTNYGGTIIPLLAQKSKPEEILGKYSGAMFNGYADIAEQIAKNKNIVLDSAVGDANKDSIFVIKVIFYGFIFYATFMYIKRQLYRRRQKNESK